MATPTINEIQTQILNTAAGADALPATAVLTENEQATLGNLTSTSKVSIFRLIIYVVAVVAWSLHKLWAILSADIDERIAVSRPFSRGWYTQTALNYQHGQELPETGIYDNTGLTIAEIAARKIVAKAAVVEGSMNGHGILRIKVAKSIDGELQPLSYEEHAGFRAYLNLMGAAGISLATSSAEADKLKVHYKIYYDPTILNNLGQRLDGTDNNPVISALRAYLIDKNARDFNGELSLQHLNDVVENVAGVTDVFLQSASSAYTGFNYDDGNPQGNVGPIVEFRQPQSGYFKLDIPNSTFQYIAR
ncbi:hypothetical protein EI546_06625 [Aequorivita sp. H23M31]|uniref:Uncharacterized protein n=1 Tax=Aequorivita ciconiae TaxID=2494375 RepID=A0A410G2B2_9FLAO|nr:hypothetical protein [Aequorivita sp. H23M31]QAA81424.1 hypothetical protein EI546_06625 [Aequorivita sp. H23M31]